MSYAPSSVRQTDPARDAEAPAEGRGTALAEREQRDTLGGAIMIHGRAASVGCLAMGDPASEELFTLAAAVGIEHVKVILAPVDFRRQPRPEVANAPAWLDDLYGQIDEALKPFPVAVGG